MDRDYELQTLGAEDRHWWYRGRRRLLHRVIMAWACPRARASSMRAAAAAATWSSWRATGP